MCGIIYNFIKSKNKKEIVNNIFTPGFVIFVFTMFAIFFIIRNNIVLLWDELRLWRGIS